MGLANAQTGKVGVNTATPTEIFDVNGTVRVRTLPVEGEVAVHTTGENASTDTGSQAYAPIGFVLTDANGVLGQLPASNNTTNESTALFVKKVYTAGDEPSGKSFTQTNTGFEVSKWDAILTINRVYRNGAKTEGVEMFNNEGWGMHLQLKEENGYWRVVGDTNSVAERTVFTILFIKKGIIASDALNSNGTENPITLF